MDWNNIDTWTKLLAIPRVSKNTAVLLLPLSTRISLIVLNHLLLVKRNLIIRSAKLKRMCTCQIVSEGFAGSKLTANVN